MRKNYFKFLLGSALALSLNTKAQTNACNELFISEIVYAKDQIAVSGNSPIDKSYALELFNPKGTDVDLTGYFIKLAVSAGADINIPLSGNITSKGTFVVGFSGSDIPVAQLSEMLSASLNFEEKTRVELWNANGIIDRIGQVNISQADAINIALAIADPVNYLNTLNLDLTSLQNFTARRKYNENQGDPNFAQPADKWVIAPNGDITNLGLHNNVCSADVLYRFFIGGGTDWCNEGTMRDMAIEVTGVDAQDNNPHSVDVIAQFGTNVCEANTGGYDYASAADISTTTLTASYAPSSGQWVTHVQYNVLQDNIAENIEYLTWTLSNPTNGAIDASSNCTKVAIYANIASIAEFEKENILIKAYPNPTTNILVVKSAVQEKISNVQIIDNIGSVVYSEKYDDPELNVQNLSSGIYILKVQMQNGRVIVKQFVKK